MSMCRHDVEAATTPFMTEEYTDVLINRYRDRKQRSRHPMSKTNYGCWLDALNRYKQKFFGRGSKKWGNLDARENTFFTPRYSARLSNAFENTDFEELEMRVLAHNTCKEIIMEKNKPALTVSAVNQLVLDHLGKEVVYVEPVTHFDWVTGQTKITTQGFYQLQDIAFPVGEDDEQQEEQPSS